MLCQHGVPSGGRRSEGLRKVMFDMKGHFVMVVRSMEWLRTHCCCV